MGRPPSALAGTRVQSSARTNMATSSCAVQAALAAGTFVLVQAVRAARTRIGTILRARLARIAPGLLITGLLPSEPEVFRWQQSSVLGLQCPAHARADVKLSLICRVCTCLYRHARTWVRTEINTLTLCPKGGSCVLGSQT